MCVIIEKPENILIAKKTIHHAWVSNPDGAGILIPDKARPMLIKGLMKKEELLYALKQIGKQYCIIHFRFATHGAVTPDNTHPFKMGDRRYLFHNGCLSHHGESGTKGMSDSAHLADDLKRLPNATVRRLLDTIPGKFIFVDRQTVTLHGQFEKYHGCFMSNTYFTPKAGVSNYTSSRYSWEDEFTGHADWYLSKKTPNKVIQLNNHNAGPAITATPEAATPTNTQASVTDRRKELIEDTLLTLDQIDKVIASEFAIDSSTDKQTLNELYAKEIYSRSNGMYLTNDGE